MAQFGNWLVTIDGIEWTGPGSNPESDSARIIPTNMLLAKQSGNLYDWPLHIVKATLTREDVYAFNTAFVFALQFHNLTTQNPFQVWLAVDRNAAVPRIRSIQNRILRMSGEMFTATQINRVSNVISPYIYMMLSD